MTNPFLPWALVLALSLIVNIAQHVMIGRLITQGREAWPSAKTRKQTMSIKDENRQLDERNLQEREAVIDELAKRIYVRAASNAETLVAIANLDDQSALGILKRHAWAAAREWYADEEPEPVEEPAPAPTPEPQDTVQRALDKLESWKK